MSIFSKNKIFARSLDFANNDNVLIYTLLELW